MAEKQRPESQHPLSEAKKWAFGGGSMISTMTNSINNTFYYLPTWSACPQPSWVW